MRSVYTAHRALKPQNDLHNSNNVISISTIITLKLQLRGTLFDQDIKNNVNIITIISLIAFAIIITIDYWRVDPNNISRNLRNISVDNGLVKISAI